MAYTPFRTLGTWRDVPDLSTPASAAYFEHAETGIFDAAAAADAAQATADAALAGVASGVPDGDKGEVTVAGSGTSWTVDTVHSGTSHAAIQTAAQDFAVVRANHTGTQAIATVTGLQAALDAKAAVAEPIAAAHISDATAAHAATAVSFSPASGIAATDVQGAIVEAKTDAVTDAATYTDDEIVALPSIEDSLDGRVTWDDTTTPGDLLPVLGNSLPWRLFSFSPAAAVVSTTTATSLITTTFTPPANRIAIGDTLEFEFWGKCTNTTAGAVTVTIRLRLAGTNWLASGAASFVQSGTRAWTYKVQGRIIAGPNLGESVGILKIGPLVNTANDDIGRTLFGSALSVDLAAWGAFDLTAQNSDGTANQSTVLLGGRCTLLKGGSSA